MASTRKPTGKAIPAKTRDAILDDVRAGGMSVRAIADKHQVSRSTVSTYAKAAGIDGGFDRSKTAAATAARVVDLAARRAEVSELLLTKARDLVEQIDEPHLVFNIGGKDNTFTGRTLDKPPTGDIRNLMQAASTALQRHIELDKFDRDRNGGPAAGFVGELAAALGVAYDQMVAAESEGQADDAGP